MFDNIEFRIELPRLPYWYELREYDFKKKYVDFYYRNLYAKNGCKIEFSAYRAEKRCFYTIGFPAPQLFYGSSVEMLTPQDLLIIPDLVSQIAADFTPFDFEADRADMTRLDISYNFDVQSEANVGAYLNHCKVSDYPYKARNIRHRYGYESVYYETEKEKIVFYPKHAQTARLALRGRATTEHLKKSIGKLRHEHRHFDEKVLELAKKFGYADTKPQTLLRPDIAEQVIGEDMKILNLDKEIVGFEETLERLREKFGYGSKYESLLGFLTACDRFGIDRVREEHICGNKRTVDARLKTLQAAGIGLSKLNAKNLPPLTAPRFDIDTEKYITVSKHRVIRSQSMSRRDHPLVTGH